MRALPERADMEMRFPVVEGYAFALTKNRIRCDIERMERLRIEPNREPTGTFVSPTVGYRVGSTADSQAPFGFATQDRSTYYAQVHLQTILVQVTQRIVDELTVGATLASSDKRRRVLALQARHQLFPKVLAIAERYVERKVDFQGVPKAELGLKRYVDQVVERIRDAILPDDSEGEPPLLPLLNRYKETGTTAEVDFKTTRPCFATQHSHINQVVADTLRWEQSAAFHLEQAAQAGIVRFYAKNESLGLVIPYEFLGVDHGYEPDYLVRLVTPSQGDVTLLLEVKGYEDNQTLTKHAGAQRWIEAVTNWGKLGRWMFHVCRNRIVEQELHYLLRTHFPPWKRALAV